MTRILDVAATLLLRFLNWADKDGGRYDIWGQR